MSAFPSFTEFFRALWHYEPFPWQAMLSERVQSRRWPAALDLPTAAGKTACIDAAVYALAAQANMPPDERTAPRRIWFVVDRRIVVDEAFRRGAQIAQTLAEAKDGPLKEVADRLRQISGTGRPLVAARLRGGTLQDDSWARLPSQPAVITSTVDQLGSRLLFSGYGHSKLSASIYAGLAANDSLILLDEAHCSVPFLQTLRSIEDYRDEAWATTPLVTPFDFAMLSATLPPKSFDEPVFPGEERERALDHPVLRKRLTTPKPADLVVVKGGGAANDLLPGEAASLAHTYVKTQGKVRVAVMVNRVKTAREIDRLLRDRFGDEVTVILLTGRIRPLERDSLVERWTRFLRAGDPDLPDRPIILVATQCLEVGADFSFDALVTEAASIDALRQRFGRLNRMGDAQEPLATILIRDATTKGGQEDPIYGNAIEATWRFLSEQATTITRAGKSVSQVDFGVVSLDKCLSEVDDRAGLLAPVLQAPVLLPAHLDLLCQTAPVPAVLPDVQLFLHGSSGMPEAQVVWRADLSEANKGSWAEIVALCPPQSGEMLSVPLYRLNNWLAAGEVEQDAEGDVEGAGGSADGATSDFVIEHMTARSALAWRGRDKSRVCTGANDIAANDVVVVPASYAMGELGQYAPDRAMGKHALDLWEPSRLARGASAALRLNADVLAPWLDCMPLRDLVSLAADPDTDPADLSQAFESVLEEQPVDTDHPQNLPEWLRDLLRAVSHGEVKRYPAGGLVMFSRQAGAKAKDERDLFADDDDLRSESEEDLSLQAHTERVISATNKMASRCLPEQYVDALRKAAFWHDTGKLDERFQLLLHEGNELAALRGDPLAKSRQMPTSPIQRRLIRRASGLPDNFRHEMLSLQLAEIQQADGSLGDLDDLVFHLIASHHGHARPFAPISIDPHPPAVTGMLNGVDINLADEARKRLDSPHSLASGVSDRFWRLTREFGWWGLAYLEAVMRLADWYGSEFDVSASNSTGQVQGSSHSGVQRAPRVPTSMPIELAGCDGANPLGFLAALGVIAAAHASGRRNVRLHWVRAATWRPILTGFPGGADELCALLDAELRGRAVSEDAKRRRLETQKQRDAAVQQVRNKENELKRRGLRGKERDLARANEVAPLEALRDERRSEWLDALSKSVSRPELALGKTIDCTPDEFRNLANSLLQQARYVSRDSLDLLAAFASDAALQKYGKVTPTPFCFITGSGHQYFLETVDQLMSLSTTERVRQVLFQSWRYADEKFSLRWDPVEDRRYALMDRDPTASDNKSRTEWIANLLAYRALALFPSAPTERGLHTVGWDRTGSLFTWPIWRNPIGRDEITSLLSSSELATQSPSRSPIRERGSWTIFRSRRLKVGSGANFKVNFGPPQGV